MFLPVDFLVGSLFRRLTLVTSSSSGVSPLESVLRLVVLERGFVEIEGALPVYHTLTIKSERALLKFKKYSISV